MKSFLLYLAPFVGVIAMFGAVFCAFASFATNDYRPIIATGIGLSLVALTCFGILLWMRYPGAIFYAVVGVPPSLLALGELLLRVTYIVFR
jgi:hypothetical protein